MLAGRRISYDLHHSASCLSFEKSYIGDISEGQFFYDRANYWLSVFNPCDGGKHYRNKFHREIDSLGFKIDKLKTLALKYGANPEEIEVITGNHPF